MKGSQSSKGEREGIKIQRTEERRKIKLYVVAAIGAIRSCKRFGDLAPGIYVGLD